MIRISMLMEVCWTKYKVKKKEIQTSAQVCELEQKIGVEL